MSAHSISATAEGSNIHFNFIAATLAGSAPLARAQRDHPLWDEEELARIASDETVLPALARHLDRLGLSVALSPELNGFLAAYRSLNQERNAQILGEAERIAFHCNELGVEPVLLKGLAYLVTGVYRDSADRFLLDIDLLVPASVAPALFDRLLSDGYLPEPGPGAAIARHYHLPRLVHPDRIPVELHTELGLGDSNRILSASDMLPRSQLRPLGSATVRVPSWSHLVTHLVVHSQLHHGYEQRIWPPLRAMHDLKMLSEQGKGQIDWSEVRNRFKTHGHLSLLNLHLLQTAKTLGMPLPYEVKLGPLAVIRWLRRRALWKKPGLSRVDPIFLWRTLALPRLRLVPSLVRTGAGREFLLKTPFRIGFYRNLIASLRYSRW